MSTFAKIGLALGGTLIFLLVSLSILVKVVVTPEKVRENLLPLVEETLQRKIDVGQITIGVFSGVSLVDLRVQKRSTPDDFIFVKTLVFKYKILPLFTGNLVIERILLEEPLIEVVRTAVGEFNFSDLLNKDKQSVSDDKTTDSKSSVFDLLVKEVSITGGELLFIDQSKRTKSPYRYQLDNLNFQASKITLDNNFPVDLSAQLNGSQIKVSGRYNIDKQDGDLDLSVTGLDLVKFAPYYREILPGKLGSAFLTLNLEAQLHSKSIDSKGKVLLEQLDLVMNDYPDAALQQASLGVDYSINYDLSKQILDLSTLFLNLNDAILAVEGAVDFASTEPVLALSLNFDQLDLRTLFDGLPKGVTRDLQPYSLAGVINGQIDLEGRPSIGPDLLKSALLELISVNASVDSVRVGINGKLQYIDQQLASEQLIMSLADQQVFVDFKATDLMGDIIRGNFQLTADQLDLNRLLPESSVAEQPSVKETVKLNRPSTIADEIGPFDLPLDMTGRLRVGKLFYKQLTLDQVQADLALKNNYLKISHLRSGIAGGEFVANSEIDLGVKGLKYQGQMELDQSNLLTLVSGLFPKAEQSVSGVLQWQNNFSGQGTIIDNLLHSLQMKGAMNLQKGQVSGSPLLEQIAFFLGIPDLKILSFDALETRYDLRNGLANVAGQLNSSKARLKPTGTVGVDGALDLKLDARIGPDLMQKLGVKTGLKQAFNDKDGWGVLPLAIKGTLTSPRVAFDTTALQSQATAKVKEEAAKRLHDELDVEGDTEQEAVKQLLKGTLNKFFGK